MGLGGEGGGRCDLAGVAKVERLFHDHRDMVYRICLSRLGDPNDAEDALQEVFLRLSRFADRLDDDPRRWLARVAATVCADELRHRQKHPRALADDEPEPTDAAADPERLVMGREILEQALSHLTTAERRVVTELWLEDRSHVEATERLGTRGSTTRVLLSRARRRLRAFFEASGDLVGTLGTGILTRAGARQLRRLLPETLQTRTRARQPLVAGNAGPAAVAFEATVVRWIAAVVVVVALAASATAPITGRSIDPPRDGPPPAISQALARDAVASRALAGGLAGVSPAPPAHRSAPRSVFAPTLGGLLDPGRDAQPEDAAITGFAYSPAYRTDHTVFATAGLVRCPDPANQCAALFVSHDGGSQWTSVDPTGFSGGQILLPPGFPADQTVFASGTNGLSISLDGGKTFSPASPLSGATTIDPGSQPHAAQVLIGGPPLTRYDQATGQSRPEPLVEPGEPGPDALLFETGNAGLLAVGQMPSQSRPGYTDEQASVCGQVGPCNPLFSWPADQSTAALVGADDGTVYAFSDTGLWRRDSSTSQFMQHGYPARVTGLAIEPDGVHLAATILDLAATNDPSLTFSSDGGGTWSAIASPPTLRGAGLMKSLTYLPDGRLLAAVTTGLVPGSWGLVCSTDAGVTWKPRC